MEPKWQLQEAKNKFSQVVDRAIHDGPQVITLRGKEAAVVMSMDEYRKLAHPERKETLLEVFHRVPLGGPDLDFSRKPETEYERQRAIERMRDVEELLNNVVAEE